MLNVFIVGVGGQGVLTIAEVIARAAQNKDLMCNFYPTKGMAQRGGFVKAQVRIAKDNIAGPEIAHGTADLAISMELSESIKAIPYVKPNGDFIVWAHKWLPTDVMLGKAHYPTVEEVVNAAKAASLNVTVLMPEDFPEDVAENICLLAAARKRTALGGVFTEDELREAMLSRFTRGTERNLRSFEAGSAC